MHAAASLLQEKVKELRMKEFMEHELENKDKQLEKLARRQQEVGHDALFKIALWLLIDLRFFEEV